MAGALVCVGHGDVANAHAVVLDVSPTNGSVLGVVPDAVTVTFNEPVAAVEQRTFVRDANGNDVSGSVQVIDATLRIGLASGLDEGTYLAAWQVISQDSHPIGGFTVFHVGSATRSAEEMLALADVSETSARGPEAVRGLALLAGYAGTLTAAGLWWFRRRWHGGDRPADGDRRLAAVQRGATVVGLVGVAAGLPARVAALGGGWSALDDGDLLRNVVLGAPGLAAAVGGVALVALLFGRPPARWPTVAALAACASFVLEGHTRSMDPRVVVVGADLVHLLAGALWVGGVVALVALPSAGAAGEHRRAALSDVSRMAGWAVLAVAASGVAMAWSILPERGALTSTGYGRVLSAKTAVVAVAVAFGAYHRFVVVRHERGARRVTLSAECVVFVAVLALTSSLVMRSPYEAGVDARPVVATSAVATLSGDAGSVRATIEPGANGRLEVMLDLLDPSGHPLVPVEAPAVDLRERVLDIGPSPLRVSPHGAGSYHAQVSLPFDGEWELNVRVRIDTFTSRSAVLRLSAGTPPSNGS